MSNAKQNAKYSYHEISLTQMYKIMYKKYIVFRLLDMGFEKEVKRFLDELDKKNIKRQTVLVSATLSAGNDLQLNTCIVHSLVKPQNRQPTICCYCCCCCTFTASPGSPGPPTIGYNYTKQLLI